MLDASSEPWKEGVEALTIQKLKCFDLPSSHSKGLFTIRANFTNTAHEPPAEGFFDLFRRGNTAQEPN